MHPFPKPVAEVLAQQRGDFDRGEQVERRHAPGDGDRMPRRGQRDEDRGQTEVHVGVGQDGGDVNAREHQGEAAEPAMKIEQPGVLDPAAHDLRGHQQPPNHRPGQQGPGHEAGCSRHVPGQGATHVEPPLVRRHSAAGPNRLATILGPNPQMPLRRLSECARTRFRVKTPLRAGARPPGLYLQEGHEVGARPGHPGSDRPDGAAADRRRLGVGEAEHLGQHEGGVPIGIQGPESG